MSRLAQTDHSSKILMRTYSLLPLTLACGVLSLPSLGLAADERVALMLVGGACPQNHAALERELLELPGIRQINLHAVPDHVLIDADTAIVDVELLAGQVNAILATHPPCHATIMKSCISADPRITSNRMSRGSSSAAPHGR